MEPLKPDQKADILATRPEASPAEIEEYERLLAERFAVDPSKPAAAPTRSAFASPEFAGEPRLQHGRRIEYRVTHDTCRGIGRTRRSHATSVRPSVGGTKPSLRKGQQHRRRCESARSSANPRTTSITTMRSGRPRRTRRVCR